jgi:hypothetical protein
MGWLGFHNSHFEACSMFTARSGLHHRQAA